MSYQAAQSLILCRLSRNDQDCIFCYLVEFDSAIAQSSKAGLPGVSRVLGHGPAA